MNRIVATVFSETSRRWKRHGIASPIHPLMHLPVPWVFVLTYLLGVGLQYVAPMRHPSASLLSIGLFAGSVCMIAGVALAAWCLRLFRTARTTTIPFEASAQLVTWGPYRFSRNPMYLSLTLIYVGEAGLLGQGWPLLLLSVTLAYLHGIVIPVEEAGLRKIFGSSYDHYCTGVHRWM